MPDLQARFKDSIRLATKNSAVLMTVISLGNTLQTTQKLDYFIDLVNQSFAEKTLSKLIIVTTGYLQRHYFSLGLEQSLTEEAIAEKAQALDSQWLEKNKPYLDRIKLPVEIIQWEDLLQREKVALPPFSQFLQQITADYSGKDPEFRNLVNEHAVSYVAKKVNHYLKGEDRKLSYDHFLKVAIDYILEECAAVLQLFKCDADLLTYPSGMNPPARHVWNHYFKEVPLRYVRYEIKRQENGYQPTLYTTPKAAIKPTDQACHLTSCYVQSSLKTVQWNRSQERRFIKEFRKLIDQIDNDPGIYQEHPKQQTIQRSHSV